MLRLPLLSGVVATCLTLSLPSPAGGQTSGFPDISARQYTGGQLLVSVTGSATIEQEIPLNVPASISDGEVTWLQFGASGSPEPHALITYGQTKEIGISVGRGKWITTGGIALMPMRSSVMRTIVLSDALPYMRKFGMSERVIISRMVM